MVNEDSHGKVFRWHGIPVASSGKGVRVALVASGGASVGLDHFGASAPAEILYEKFGLTAEHLVKTAKELLGR